MDLKNKVTFDKIDTIAVITLNQPDKLNTMDWELLEDIVRIQNTIEEDNSIRAVLIKANGKHFCAGMNLEVLKTWDAQFMLEKLEWLQRFNSRWQELTVPVVAAIQGYCIGGGVEMILGYDIKVAADNSRFRLPEVSLGLSPDMGGTTRLTKLIGLGQAKRLIMANDEIDAQEALRIGLVELVVPLEELESRAMDLAVRMSKMPPISMRWAKRGINLANESSVNAGLLFEQAQSICCFMTDDLKEGISAFIEKRKPKFQGK